MNTDTKRSLKFYASTDGSSIWASKGSHGKKIIVGGTLHFGGLEDNEEGLYGADAEFVFETEGEHGWDTGTLGLIYTDKGFLHDIHTVLKNEGFPYWNEIDYSEQGMQGENFVHFDVSKRLYKNAKMRGYA